MIPADFHVHSTFSDGKLTIPELVDLYGSRGFGALAVTDHLCEERSLLGKAAAALGRTLTRASFPDYLKVLEEEAARAWEQYRMVVIPGVELTKNSIDNYRSAHVLALGVDQFLSADEDVALLARRIREYGGVSIAAHPVWTRKLEKQSYHLWDRREELATLYDAWEVASGSCIFDEVARSRLPKIANSDLHHPRQISSWKTVVHSERHPQAILEAIRSQDLSFRFYLEEPHETKARLISSYPANSVMIRSA